MVHALDFTKSWVVFLVRLSGEGKRIPVEDFSSDGDSYQTFELIVHVVGVRVESIQF